MLIKEIEEAKKTFITPVWCVICQAYYEGEKMDEFECPHCGNNHKKFSERFMDFWNK